jgi:hypothetical protein
MAGAGHLPPCEPGYGRQRSVPCSRHPPAAVDRLTFGGNITETGTDSYRLAATRATRAAQQAVTRKAPRPATRDKAALFTQGQP